MRQRICSVDTDVFDGAQQDGPCERLPLGSLVSSSGPGSGPVIPQQLDGHQQDGQSKPLPLGLVLSPSSNPQRLHKCRHTRNRCVPKYHMTYKEVLGMYRSIRTGQGFHPSRRVVA